MKTTTDAKNWLFHFTVTDLARFLGKSPVTLRHWERQGLVVFPRDSSGDRRVTADEIRHLARIAHRLGRISTERLHMVEASITLLKIIEKENVENSTSRSTKLGQNGASPAASGKA